MGRQSKYNARKVRADGHIFDSQAEYRRYNELRMMEQAGEICSLTVHPRFLLIVNDHDCGYYEADFRYYDVGSGRQIVEDVKGVKTAIYQLKKRLVRAIYGIEITEVQA